MGSEVAIIGQPVVPVFGFNEVEKIATAIARGGLFGSKDPYAVLTLCMLAQAEGQHPAVVFRDYDLIQGKPAKKAEAMLRDFIGGGGKVVWNRLDDECADATFSHPQGGTVTINWTMARAVKAGIGGKAMWKQYPRQMLRSRVVSEGVRTVYPNATSGLYVPEEVRDFDNAPANDTPPTPQAQRARDLTPITKAEPDPAAALAELEQIAGPGNADALAAAWQGIGKDARKALADELPRLKAMCENADPETGEIGPDDAEDTNTNDVEPAQAKADAIIAEINAANAVIDVNSIHSRHQADIEAMPDAMGASVEIAADKRKTEIKAEQAAAKAKEAA